MFFQLRRLLYIWIITLLIVGFGVASCSAEVVTIPSVRPKLGLALGGGSAAGFAHIGVLRWLEENRIPVDYIAGTSMGGLMGGCYAMGMTPEEIRRLASTIDWREIFDPNPPYEALGFRRKEDRHDYPVPVEVGLRDSRFRLPGGLNVYQVGFIFSRIALPYSTLTNFDELPIPFRCTATDIRNAEPVVMGDGSLAEALRATMAIPGVFTPVERDGQLLVDGGVLDSVPADIVKQMGANIIIAVKVTPFDSRRETESLDSVFMGTIDTVIETNSRQSLNLADMTLVPDTNRLGLFNWEKVDEYIELGYQAANNLAPALRRYSLDALAWQNYIQQRQNRLRFNSQTPAGIEVDGVSIAQKANIQKQLQKYIGHPVDTALLEKDLTAIIGSGLYECIFYEYRIIGGKPVLAIKVKEKTYGPPFMLFGFQFSTAGVSTANSVNTIRSRLTVFDIAGPGSELRVDLGVGTVLNFQSELYKPLFASRWFLAPGAFLAQNNHCLFTAGAPMTGYQITNGGLRLGWGYAFNNSLEARLGYTVESQTAQTRVGVPLPSDFSGTVHRAGFQWTYRQGDDAVLLHKGFHWDMNADWYFAAPGAAKEFGQAKSKLLWSIPAGPDAIYTMLSAGVSWNGIPPLPQQYRLGGPFQLGAYHVDELQGANFLLGSIGYLKSLGKLPLTGDKLYLGIFAENGGVYQDWARFEPVWDLSAGFLSGTILGLLYVGISYGRDAQVMLNVELGRVF